MDEDLVRQTLRIMIQPNMIYKLYGSYSEQCFYMIEGTLEFCLGAMNVDERYDNYVIASLNNAVVYSTNKYVKLFDDVKRFQ